MKLTIDTIKKTALLIGGLLLSVLSANADDVQKKLNLNYFRSPEAAAFMKYGEESVNEYTGTANISVPLYTIKCKDIEIPIVLNYNASGIKVEQEASWVGLGWDLTVGGCVNYICAGAKDCDISSNIHDSIWTQYFTTVNLTQYYKYKKNETSNWMGAVPYEHSFVHRDGYQLINGMRAYAEYGNGERDFFSVNILGKSFMFFVDPLTKKTFKIGPAGEEFKIESDPALEEADYRQQNKIKNWIITDSKGYIYKFREGDQLQDAGLSNSIYTSCWYLVEILSPQGEKVELSYTELPRHYGRKVLVETLDLPFLITRKNSISEYDYPYGYKSYLTHAFVNYFYLNKIKVGNQTVIFNTSDCKSSSGKRLDKIAVLSNGTLFKTFDFSYDKVGFGYSDTGGNYAPADGINYSEYRLKLDNVKEITSSDTLTTSFFYKSLNLPSKKILCTRFLGVL